MEHLFSPRSALLNVLGFQTSGEQRDAEKAALEVGSVWNSERDALRRSGLSFAAIAERRRAGERIVSEYCLDWRKVAIGLPQKKLEKLQSSIQTLAEAMSDHSLGMILLVEKANHLTDKMAAEVIEVGLCPPSWLRDCYFPTDRGLVELANSRRDFWPNITEFLIKAAKLKTEILPGFRVRRGDFNVGEKHVFVGVNTWHHILDVTKDISKAKAFLQCFFNGRTPVILPGEFLDTEDIPDWMTDLDFYFTLVGDNQAMVAQAVCPSRTPKCDFLFEDVARKMESLGYRVARLPCDPKMNKTYNNCLIQGPKKLAFIPQYGEKDELWPMVEESFGKFGFASHPVPFLTSFVKDNFGALCCLTLPLPNSSS